ncbi:uncharacterized protein FIBRA_05197 [Fibroporia radiculosa]|uniref:Uncharacterized protein n=1 Tax=Fibroporia radiculosa TaxID=599839 RepID=J4HX42_9APHY|nr:uncharacterized protein FIBRA_05197 [Fibroporia radiculosa]CCM03077.1 predicted protein [Fibroporia radiculosa]
MTEHESDSDLSWDELDSDDSASIVSYNSESAVEVENQEPADAVIGNGNEKQETAEASAEGCLPVVRNQTGGPHSLGHTGDLQEPGIATTSSNETTPPVSANPTSSPGISDADWLALNALVQQVLHAEKMAFIPNLLGQLYISQAFQNVQAATHRAERRMQLVVEIRKLQQKVSNLRPSSCAVPILLAPRRSREFPVYEWPATSGRCEDDQIPTICAPSAPITHESSRERSKSRVAADISRSILVADSPLDSPLIPNLPWSMRSSTMNNGAPSSDVHYNVDAPSQSGSAIGDSCVLNDQALPGGFPDAANDGDSDKSYLQDENNEPASVLHHRPRSEVSGDSGSDNFTSLADRLSIVQDRLCSLEERIPLPRSGLSNEVEVLDGSGSNVLAAQHEIFRAELSMMRDGVQALGKQFSDQTESIAKGKGKESPRNSHSEIKLTTPARKPKIPVRPSIVLQRADLEQKMDLLLKEIGPGCSSTQTTTMDDRHAFSPAETLLDNMVIDLASSSPSHFPRPLPPNPLCRGAEAQDRARPASRFAPSPAPPPRTATEEWVTAQLKETLGIQRRQLEEERRKLAGERIQLHTDRFRLLEERRQLNDDRFRLNIERMNLKRKTVHVSSKGPACPPPRSPSPPSRVPSSWLVRNPVSIPPLHVCSQPRARPAPVGARPVQHTVSHADSSGAWRTVPFSSASKVEASAYRSPEDMAGTGRAGSAGDSIQNSSLEGRLAQPVEQGKDQIASGSGGGHLDSESSPHAEDVVFAI